jgi:hypothetical protein
LLGTEDHGRWLLAPALGEDGCFPAVVERRYRDSTFILETLWQTGTGEALVTEFMPVADNRASLVRRVQGIRGHVRMRQEIEIRFGFGKVVPWVSRTHDDGSEVIMAIGGPHAVMLRADVLPQGGS